MVIPLTGFYMKKEIATKSSSKNALGKKIFHRPLWPQGHER